MTQSLAVRTLCAFVADPCSSCNSFIFVQISKQPLNPKALADAVELQGHLLLIGFGFVEFTFLNHESLPTKFCKRQLLAQKV